MTTLAVRPHQVCLGCLILDFLPYVSENAKFLVVIESYGQILVKETRRSDCATDPPFAPFARSVQAALGSTWPANLIFSNFIVALDDKLEVALESPDNLINLFNSFEKMVLTVTARPEQEGIGADTCSALGFFLRKLTIGFSSLSFEHVCQLLDSLRSYFYPNNGILMNGNKLCAIVISEEEAAQGRQVVVFNDEEEDHEGNDANIGTKTIFVRSGAELQRFVRSQTEQFEHQISTQDQQSLEAPLHTIIASSSSSTIDAGRGGGGGVPRSLECPEIHQSLFTSATLHKDPAAALEHLHSYFDHWPQAGQDMDDNELNSLLFLGPPSAPVVNQLSHDTSNNNNNNNNKRQGAVAAATRTAAVQKRLSLQERSQLQHAALALATVHARLGHVEEAMQALNETVRIAQQRGDDAALVNALAILCQIMDMTTPGTITGVGDVNSNIGRIAAARHYSQLRGLLKRLLHRARQMKMPHLVAYATLAMASSEFVRRFDPVALGKKVPPVEKSGTGVGGRGGGGFTLPHTTTTTAPPPPPTAAVVWSQNLFNECEPAINTGFAVQDTAHLDLAASLAAATPAVPPAPSAAGSSAGNASARILRGVADLFTVASDIYGPALSGSEVLRSCAQEVGKKSGSALLLRSTCWAVCGNTRLAKAQALAYIHAHPHNSNNINNSSSTAEETLVAFAQLAASIAAESGPAAALPLLETVTDTLFPSSSSTPSSLSFQCTKLAICHDRALHRGNLALAQQISAEMTALASPADATGISLRLEGEVRVVKTILASGDYPAAARAAAHMFDVAQNTGQPMYAARLLVLLGKIHLRGGAAGVGLRYLESAKEEGRLMRLDQLEAEAAVLAAEAWCEVAAENDTRKEKTNRASPSSSVVRAAVAAQKEIERCLPVIRSYGNLELKSDTLLTLARVMCYKHKNDDTLVPLDRDKDSNNSGDGKRMVDALTEAAAGYMVLEDCHHAARAMRTKALVLDAMGDVGGRNVAAGEYKRLCMDMKMNC